jgi:hypothetical protein
MTREATTRARVHRSNSIALGREIRDALTVHPSEGVHSFIVPAAIKSNSGFDGHDLEEVRARAGDVAARSRCRRSPNQPDREQA